MHTNYNVQYDPPPPQLKHTLQSWPHKSDDPNICATQQAVRITGFPQSGAADPSLGSRPAKRSEDKSERS